jgi:hypothetical protein
MGHAASAGPNGILNGRLAFVHKCTLVQAGDLKGVPELHLGPCARSESVKPLRGLFRGSKGRRDAMDGPVASY